MSDDSDYDEIAHDRLLASIQQGKTVRAPIRKVATTIDTNDLLNEIKSTKNVADTKKQVDKASRVAKKKGATETLAAPLHRIARQRIEGAVGLVELKKDVKVWEPIVEKQRTAEHLNFVPEVVRLELASDRAASFKPRTELEKEMAEVLASSKHNLKNDETYTEAELEIIRAMSVKEAKAKCAQMQKMRSLMSFRQAKLARQAKIKSKGYHRILKRQKRKQLLKEFDDLIARDPEAAKEKLKELDNQRIKERATLKHRAGNKFNKDLAKHASRDSAARKMLDDHIRLGKELKEKVAAGLAEESESGSEDEEDEDAGVMDKQTRMTISQMIAAAAEAAAKDDGSDNNKKKKEDKEKELEQRITLHEMRKRKREELEAARLNKKKKEEAITPVFAEDDDWTVVTAENADELCKEQPDEGKVQAASNKAKTEKKKKGKKAKPEAKEDVIVKDIDDMFDDVEQAMLNKTKKEIEAMKALEEFDASVAAEEEPKKKRKKNKKGEASGEKEKPMDAMLDPNNFLQLETNDLAKVSSDLVEKMDEFDQDTSNAAALAEAFRDDDVVGDFEAEKELIEEGEKPKDVDLTLFGWGTWTGPGMDDSRKRRYVVKAKQQKRKDGGFKGVIIKEQTDMPIEKLQPRGVPFPFTSVDDFEAVIRQPIGKDWNSASAHTKMIKPAVATKGGRVIKAMNKKEMLNEKFVEGNSDDE